MSWQRPASLAAVAAQSETWEEVASAIADFLHEFQRRQDLAMLEESPPLLVDRFPGGEIADAYLAAVGATLAEQYCQPAPEWTRAPERYLHHPWFATPGAAMRACLLLESPARFRERNLFVTANALSVA